MSDAVYLLVQWEVSLALQTMRGVISEYEPCIYVGVMLKGRLQGLLQHRRSRAKGSSGG